jgi:Xaa-Pro aminopeptidase
MVHLKAMPLYLIPLVMLGILVFFNTFHVDSIIIDFGGSFGGYSSDTTRTFAYGEPGEEFRKAYESVKEAQYLAMESVSDGARYNDLDMSARKLLSKMGYGEMEIRLGHGLGIEVHEPPFLTKDNSDKIREGTVFTVEPGIYRYGKYGIRIEDTTYVKNSNVFLLTA